MSNTYYLSLLCPAFATKTKQKNPDFIEMCNNNMGMDLGDNVEFFKLVKIDPNSKNENNEDVIEVAVRLKNSDFSMKTIESIIQQKEKLQEQISKLTSYWSTMGDELPLGDSKIDNIAFIQLRDEVEKNKTKTRRLEDDNK